MRFVISIFRDVFFGFMYLSAAIMGIILVPRKLSEKIFRMDLSHISDARYYFALVKSAKRSMWICMIPFAITGFLFELIFGKKETK
jgi:hypothetical protein